MTFRNVDTKNNSLGVTLFYSQNTGYRKLAHTGRSTVQKLTLSNIPT